MIQTVKNLPELNPAGGTTETRFVILAMQRRHDLAGGSAPHLNIRSLNGWNEGYGPMDRHVKPHASVAPFVQPKARIA